MSRGSAGTASALTRRLAGDSLWIAIDTAAARGGVMIAMLIAARALGPKEFGALVTVQATVTLLSSIVSYAMRLTTTSELARLNPTNQPAVARSLATIVRTTWIGTSLLAVIAAALHEPIATHVLGRSDLSGLLLLAVALLIIDGISSLQLGVLTGCRAMRAGAICGVIASIALIAAVAVGTHSAGTVGALGGLIAGGVVGIIARWVPSRHALRGLGLFRDGRAADMDFGVLMRTSLPFVLMNILWTPTMWLGSLMLVRSPDGYTEMGYLGAANQWFALLLFLPNVLGFSTMHMLAQSTADGPDTSQRFREAVRVSMRSSLVAAVPLAAVAALVSPWLMHLYGGQYRSAWPTLALLAAAAVPASMFGVMTNVLTVTRRWRMLVMAQAAWAVTYLCVAGVGVDIEWGAAALAAAMLAGNLMRLLCARAGMGSQQLPG